MRLRRKRMQWLSAMEFALDQYCEKDNISNIIDVSMSLSLKVGRFSITVVGWTRVVKGEEGGRSW